MKRLNQSGSHVLALVLVIAALAIVGLVGYRVQQSNKDDSAITTASTESVPATINSGADLAATNKALDQSLAQLDSSLDDSSLNSDLNSML